MKKIFSALLISFFAVTFMGTTVFASTEAKSSTEILHEIEDIANGSNSLELVDVNELPEGTPFINFDTVEEFEKAVKELEIENENTEYIVEEDVSPIDQIVTFAATKSRTDRLKVLVKPSWNPIIAIAQPASVTVDLGYSYTGSGTSKKFKKINKVSSFSLGFPTNWKQTSYNKSFYSSNKGVKLELLGYHLFGASIGGQPIGAKAPDTISFNYKLGGTKNLIEK